jgi:hypothetical protein
MLMSSIYQFSYCVELWLAFCVMWGLIVRGATVGCRSRFLSPTSYCAIEVYRGSPIERYETGEDQPPDLFCGSNTNDTFEHSVVQVLLQFSTPTVENGWGWSEY